MVLQLDISSDTESKLRAEAAKAGLPVERYLSSLIENIVSRLPVDVALAPFRAQVAASGMSDEELEQFYEGLRNEVWRERTDHP